MSTKGYSPFLFNCKNKWIYPEGENGSFISWVMPYFKLDKGIIALPNNFFGSFSFLYSIISLSEYISRIVKVNISLYKQFNTPLLTLLNPSLVSDSNFRFKNALRSSISFFVVTPLTSSTLTKTRSGTYTISLKGI